MSLGNNRMEKVFAERLGPLVGSYKNDPESVYNTWFVGSEARLKAFRSIRRGVGAVVQDIRTGLFPNDFKVSSMEFVLACITEQKQVFEGAAHPFYWKPRLHIPADMALSLPGREEHLYLVAPRSREREIVGFVVPIRRRP